MEEKHYCKQCGKETGYQWLLISKEKLIDTVCGKCNRLNHNKGK